MTLTKFVFSRYYNANCSQTYSKCIKNSFKDERSLVCFSLFIRILVIVIYVAHQLYYNS